MIRQKWLQGQFYHREFYAPAVQSALAHLEALAGPVKTAQAWKQVSLLADPAYRNRADLAGLRTLDRSPVEKPQVFSEGPFL